MGEEEGAQAFDQDEYRNAMEALRRGFMSPNDLQGMQFDAPYVSNAPPSARATAVTSRLGLAKNHRR